MPFLGGVLIDRLDRRYLGVLLDVARGFVVLGTAYIAGQGHLALWHLYAMTLVTGIGSAMYWATVNALVQEVIPGNQFTGANAAVLVGVQSGMLIAGACAGFLYDSVGIAGILAIDGATYFVSAFCLYQMRRGYVSPRDRQRYPREYSEATEATALALESGENPEVAEAGLSLAVYADLKEGFAYLKKEPRVRALGITHAAMMAGVVSGNVVLVALVSEILGGGARTSGFSGGRLGDGGDFRRICSQPAFAGLANDFVCDFGGGVERRALYGAVGYVSGGRGGGADDFRILPGDVRSGGAVVADVDRAAAFHGPHAVGDRDSDDRAAAADELFAGLAGAEHQHLRGIRAAGRNVRRSRILRDTSAAVAGSQPVRFRVGFHHRVHRGSQSFLP